MNFKTFRKIILNVATVFTTILIMSMSAQGQALPKDKIETLKTTVIGMNLDQGFSTSLEAKLEVALGALDDNNQHNDAAAINSLTAFKNAVQAQVGNYISTANADILIADTDIIISQLNNGGCCCGYSCGCLYTCPSCVPPCQY